MDPPTQTLPSTSKPAHLRRWTLILVRGAILIYLGLAIMFFLLQTKLIFPGAATQGQRGATLNAGYNSELLHLKAGDGETIAAIFGKALTRDGQPLASAALRPTVIYFYGNGSCMAYSSIEFDRFRRLGLNVIVPDFEGYGMSSGAPSESGCYAAADAAYSYLLTRGDIDAKKIVTAGWSLGAAVAIDLAARKPIAAVMTFSAFTRMSDMARLVIPWMPTSLLLRHRFDNLGKIATLNCPIFISHGTEDQLIPPDMALRLAAAAKSPVTHYDIIGANHNDVFDTGGEPLFTEVSRFLKPLN